MCTESDRRSLKAGCILAKPTAARLSKRRLGWTSQIGCITEHQNEIAACQVLSLHISIRSPGRMPNAKASSEDTQGFRSSFSFASRNEHPRRHCSNKINRNHNCCTQITICIFCSKFGFRCNLDQRFRTLGCTRIARCEHGSWAFFTYSEILRWSSTWTLGSRWQ